SRKNVRKRLSHDGAKSKLLECPHGVLSRAATPEVSTGDQHLRIAGPGTIQREFRPGMTELVVPPVVEELIAKPLLRQRFEESRRDDLVRIDVVDGQHDDRARKDHRRRLRHSMFLTSATTPATAVATAVSGLARNVRA